MAKTEKISRKSRVLRQLPKTDPEYRQKVEWLQDPHARRFAAEFLYPEKKPARRNADIWQKACLEEINGKPKYRWEFNNAEFVKLEEAKKLYLEKEKQRLKNL